MIDGGFEGAFGTYRTLAELALATVENNRRANRRAQAESLTGSPPDRARFVLGAITSITDGQRDALYGEIERRVPGFRPQMGAGTRSGIETPRYGNVDEVNAAVDEVILSSRFDDPALERARQAAAREWRTLGPQVDRGAARLNRR